VDYTNGNYRLGPSFALPARRHLARYAKRRGKLRVGSTKGADHLGDLHGVNGLLWPGHLLLRFQQILGVNWVSGRRTKGIPNKKPNILLHEYLHQAPEPRFPDSPGKIVFHIFWMGF